jgi:molybdopterin-biosynthesis enzyme MoeA-like protein
MLDYVAPQLKTGIKMLSETLRADCREGDIGTELGAIAKAHPAVVIGSYPFIDENRRANAHIVLRSRDPQKLAEAKAAVHTMLKQVQSQLGVG